MELDINDLSSKIKALQNNIETVIKGKHNVVKTALIALFSRGHMLIEDVPGVGKTTLAHTLANSTQLTFKRIQFTSDLLPSDILGVSILDQNTGEFKFKKGPIFTNIVLADEINRATPKTQSALLEAMNESMATIDGNTYELPKPFLVIATQNPFEFKGTFPLPENQLDRFSIRISIGYPDNESEKQILSRSGSDNSWDEITPAISYDDVIQIQHTAQRVTIDDSLLDYILKIINETRNPKLFDLGISPRGTIALKKAAQASALIDGRTYCIPDDIKEMVIPVLAHRVVIRNESLSGQGRKEALEEVLQKIEVPV